MKERAVARITIEPGEAKEPTYCECCGNKTLTVHGFVYNNNDAYAVYFASWTIGHLERGVTMAIGLGQWGEGATPNQRRSVSLECRTTEEQIQFAVIDPGQSPLGRTEFLGRMLPRDAALKDAEIKEFFHIAEHVVHDDPRISSFINEA
jgi:hypothetical protein